MDYVRQHVAGVVARSRPELGTDERDRLVEQVIEVIRSHAAEPDIDPVRMVAVGDSQDFFGHRRAPANDDSPPFGSDRIGFLAVCDLDGTFTEVIRDRIGVGPRFAPGSSLMGIVSPFHLRRATRFLRTIRQFHAAYDCSLSVLGRSGMVSLFCSGFAVGSRIVAIGTREPMTVSIPQELGQLAQDKPETLSPVLKELAAWRKNRAAIQPASKPDSSQGKNSRRIAQEHPTAAGRRRLLELAAHDLRNPISGILAACQYLLEDATRVLEPHQILVLCSIESSTRLALQLIQNLGEIPTIRIDKPKLELQQTDILSVLHEAASGVRPLADNLKVKLHVRGKDHLPALKGDPVKLGEAFHGLFVNAMGSRMGGKIEVTVGASAGGAQITFQREYGASAGPPPAPPSGTSASSRLPRKLSDVHAALLLARAKRILKAHGGAIRFEHHETNGQSWNVTLPIAAVQLARKS